RSSVPPRRSADLAAYFVRSSSSSFRIGTSESAINAPSSTPSALTSSCIAHPLIQFLNDVIHDGRDGALLLFRLGRIIFTWRIVRRLRLDRVLVRVNDLVLTNLVDREILLLQINRIAAIDRRTVEPHAALIRSLNAAADELRRNLCALAFVHTQQRLEIELDTLRPGDRQTLIEQALDRLDMTL